MDNIKIAVLSSGTTGGEYMNFLLDNSGSFFRVLPDDSADDMTVAFAPFPFTEQQGLEALAVMKYGEEEEV